jgi:hypothetical protein
MVHTVFDKFVNLLTIGVKMAVPIPSTETQKSHSILRSLNANVLMALWYRSASIAS